MSRLFALLLPPSMGKRPGGDGPAWDTTDGRFGMRLADRRRAVADALRRAEGGDAALIGAKGSTLERALVANRALIGAPTFPAGHRYSGVVWDHLDLGSLTAITRARAADAIVVLSPLAGLVSIDDPLPDHRLSFSAAPAPLGRLSAWWRTELSSVLNDHLAGRLVIDLLPQEQRAAWVPDPGRYDLRRAWLRTTQGRAGGHDAKAAKGRLAHDLVAGRSVERVLERWTDDTYELVVEHVGGIA